MKLIIFFIDAVVLLIALGLVAKYILPPLIEYYPYYAKRRDASKVKSKEEIAEELEAIRLKRELWGETFEQSNELVGRLDSIFEEGRRHQPRRKTEK